MLARINIGGVEVYFGDPSAPNKPEPFYPFLVQVDVIRDNTGDETGSTSFKLTRAAAGLLYLNLRRKVAILSDDLTEVIFEGVISRLSYAQDIAVTVEA